MEKRDVLNINIYGSKKFVQQMTSLLSQANLKDISVEVKDVDKLEELISNNPNDIFLIDSEKIISKNIIRDKINFLKPKDSIYKETLIEFGIDDMCFNSDEALLNYIIDKIDKYDSPDTNNSMLNEKQEEINMDDITQIEQINENDLITALDAKIENIDTNKILEESISADAIEEKPLENKIELSSENIDDVSELLKQLLNNKTLELSIKIKD